MPGDTRLQHLPNGWVDLDDGSVYPCRRLARLARRARNGPRKLRQAKATTVTRNVTNVLYMNPQVGAASSLTSLQEKLFKRLTNRQGVDYDDALDVVLHNGYNKAASYGHMRAAGANHSEALRVIALGSPSVSKVYGEARGRGLDHSAALDEALHLAVV